MQLVDAPSQSKPIRLIQYLGSKLNILDELVPELKTQIPFGGTCIDLFSGTAVVGQSLIGHCSVFSNDCSVFSKLLADVLIVGPSDASLDLPLPKVEVLTNSQAYRKNADYLKTIYHDALVLEDKLVQSGDGDGLGEFCKTLPTWWKKKSCWRNTRKVRDFVGTFDRVPKQGQRFSFPACLFTTYYASSYFGLKQSIEIDSLRFAIEKLRGEHRLTDWQAQALLAGLISAISRSVSSAGKHFAQPLIVQGESQRPFALRRTLSDRLLQITGEMEMALVAIERSANQPRMQNRSFSIDFEKLTKESTELGSRGAFLKYFGVHRVDCIYADPPYTAQQYSRFYHILETLIMYDYPNLQLQPRNSGSVTQGLYREGRHKSIFCSRTGAPVAFEALFSIASQVTDCLVLSYSSTNIGSGNPRMIETELIASLAKRYFGHTLERTLEHRYRKLNREEHNRREGDQEKLYIMCSKP